ncbi:MAG: hypothetical protein R3F61_01470 [Myxococcota bacterium]
MRAFVPILLLVGCTTSRAIKPLPKGTGAVTASLGGPFDSDLGVTFPLPLTSIGYMHGLDGKTNLHGSFFPTGLLAFGVPGASVGIARELWPPDGPSPRLMVDGTLSMFGGDASKGPPGPEFRVFADTSAVLSWDLRAHSVYTGLDVFLQPGPTVNAHLTPLVGTELRAGRTSVAFEAEWLVFYQDNRPLAANWWGPAHRGALQVQVGLAYRLGRNR